MLRSGLRSLLNRFGLDVVRHNSSPRLTWLGLRDRDIRLVLDVGANTGQFAMEAHRAFPRARVICFEPLADVAQTLRANLERSSIVAQVLNVALSDEPGEKAFYLHVGHSPSSSLLPTTEHAATVYPQTADQRVVTVRVDTLDATLAVIGPPSEGEALLKVDVQGNELRVLRGASGTLRRIDHVLCEINFDPLYEGQPSFAEICDYLTTAGFSYAGALQQVYGPNGRVVFADELFTRRDLRSTRS
jgi:FkbM family methyltransferase